MLGEALQVIPALDHVKGDVGPVAAAEGVAGAIEVEAPGVASAFGEELKPPRTRVVSPDPLLKFGAANPCGDGASLCAIEPAVGPPGHRVHRGVGVLKAKAREQHFGLAVGPVVAVSIGVEQQIRGLADKDPPVTDSQAGGQVQAVDEDGFFVGPAVAVGVFEDLDPVRATRAARGRIRDTVVLGAQVLIDRDRLEPRRVGILKILDHPEPAALVKTRRERLPHHRFGSEHLDVEARRHNHPPRSLFRREAARFVTAGRGAGDENQHKPTNQETKVSSSPDHDAAFRKTRTWGLDSS